MSALEEAAEVHPMKRFGLAEEIGAMATFLASDKCRFLTGQSIDIDGGASFQGPVATVT